MEIRIDDIVRKNINTLMVLRGIQSENALSKSSGVSQKTVNFLMDEDVISNPTVNVLKKLSKTLKVESWMLLIPDFPFASIKDQPLKTISPLTYSAMKAIEKEPDDVKLLILESIAATLSRIDDHTSNQIRDAQAAYLSERRRETT